MKYTEEQLEQIRQLKIPYILGIKDTGRRMMLKCPSPNHRDGTPSFSLETDGRFNCFGCGIKGKGAIDFIMQTLDVSFKDALQELESVL